MADRRESPRVLPRARCTADHARRRSTTDHWERAAAPQAPRVESSSGERNDPSWDASRVVESGAGRRAKVDGVEALRPPTGPGALRHLISLVVAGVVLYGLAPALLEVLGAYRQLRDLDAVWWIAVVAAAAAGNWCMCALQRLALNRVPWFPVASSQLAGNAFSKVVPGGSAAAAALQARMLVQAGLSPTATGTGLTAGAFLLLGALAGLPLLAFPALLFGRHIPDGLLQTGAIGLAVFAALFVAGALLLVNDRVLRTVAWVLQGAMRRLSPWRAASDELTERLFGERDRLRKTLGGAWPQAVATAAGRWIFDFLCLYAALLAIGVRPPLYVALLAYSAAQLLGQLPFTPGGLGLVEAGLTGTLALAGVAAAPAALATLAYRLVSYWLAIPVGLGAWIWHRRRYSLRSGLPGERATASG